MFFDVHAHLTHERFKDDIEQVIARAEEKGLGIIVVNGLEPESNRQTLALAAKYSIVKPALGIYPLDAANAVIKAELPFEVPKFNVDDEIKFIEEQAKAGKLIAIGECGLDGHWIKEDTFAEQERVFEALVGIAMDNDLPVIIHTRKREQRSVDILRNLGTKYVDFHCFGGRSAFAKDLAERDGWWFSIPSTANRNGSFQKMLKNLPIEKLLTETDCPYQGPVKGERNDPSTVVGTVELFAEYRGLSLEDARDQMKNNLNELLSCGSGRDVVGTFS
jgi:TatD DNase family protein